VQINGKIRDTVVVAADADDETIRETVLASERVAAHLEGKELKKFIVVKRRLVSLAVK
jgi:leucyl-tRNA synthetase